MPRAWLLSPPEPHSRWQARLGRFYLGWRAFTRNPLAVLGPRHRAAADLRGGLRRLLAPYSPIAGGDLRTSACCRRARPIWFGTDDQARDIFSRIVYGSRITLCVVVLVSIIATPIGLLVGTVAGYLGGWVDTVLMRITDIFLAFPRLDPGAGLRGGAWARASRTPSSPSRSRPGRLMRASRAPRR